MILQFLLVFLVLVTASYVGTTMALRGFFGRERYAPPTGVRPDERPTASSDGEEAGRE